MKSGNLNFLEPSGPLQACNGTSVFVCTAYSEVFLYIVPNKILEQVFEVRKGIN
jgi:hypothetical protein